MEEPYASIVDRVIELAAVECPYLESEDKFDEYGVITLAPQDEYHREDIEWGFYVEDKDSVPHLIFGRVGTDAEWHDKIWISLDEIGESGFGEVDTDPIEMFVNGCIHQIQWSPEHDFCMTVHNEKKNETISAEIIAEIVMLCVLNKRDIEFISDVRDFIRKKSEE